LPATHTFDFVLADGEHTLDVKVAESMRSTASTGRFLFETAGERWGIMDLTTTRCDPCSSAEIKWQLEDAQPKK